MENPEEKMTEESMVSSPAQEVKDAREGGTASELGFAEKALKSLTHGKAGKHLRAWVAALSLMGAAGKAADRMEAGLDYHHQEEQVRWAKMHAQTLLRLIRQRQAPEEERDYIDLLQPDVRRLHQRRILREQ